MAGYKKFLAVLLLIQPLHASWYDLRAEGWYYFEEEEKKPKAPHFEQIEKTKLPGELKTELFQKELKKSLHEMIWHPSDENIKEYVSLQNAMLQKNSVLSENVQLFYLNHPEHSFEREVPNALHARGIKKVVEEQREQELLAEAAKDFGLLFFYRGQDPQSSFFSQIVREFAMENGFVQLSISLDGSLLDQEDKTDNGIAAKLGVLEGPAVYLLDAKRNQYFAIANSSSVSLEKLQSNALLQLKNRRLP